MASKELRLLEAGDKITTIWMAASYSGDDDFEMYTAEELTVTDSTSFGEAELPDGSYAMVFEMWDAMGNDAYSDAVTFDCENGEIWTPFTSNLIRTQAAPERFKNTLRGCSAWFYFVTP